MLHFSFGASASVIEESFKELLHKKFISKPSRAVTINKKYDTTEEEFIKKLENDFYKGQDNYPDNDICAYNLLVNYKNKRFAHSDLENELALLSNGRGERRELKDATYHK